MAGADALCGVCDCIILRANNTEQVLVLAQIQEVPAISRLYLQSFPIIISEKPKYLSHQDISPTDINSHIAIIMKSEVNRISNLFLTEMKLLSLILSSIRRHKHNAASVLSISFILFFAGRGITEAHLPAIPFLRGGYSSYSVPAAKPMGLGMKPIGKLYGLSNLKRTLTHIGEKIRLKPKQTQSKEAAGNQHLDEVLGAFTHVLNGNDIDTAQLLKACKAHLKLMKSGGASLRLVAKDLETNLLKAEKPFKKAPKQGKTLYSLLESERHSGIHKEGNELENESAAMVCMLFVKLHFVLKSLDTQNSLFLHLFYAYKGTPLDPAISCIPIGPV